MHCHYNPLSLNLLKNSNSVLNWNPNARKYCLTFNQPSEGTEKNMNLSLLCAKTKSTLSKSWVSWQATLHIYQSIHLRPGNSIWSHGIITLRAWKRYLNNKEYIQFLNYFAWYGKSKFFCLSLTMIRHILRMKNSIKIWLLSFNLWNQSSFRINRVE